MLIDKQSMGTREYNHHSLSPPSVSWSNLSLLSPLLTPPKTKTTTPWLTPPPAPPAPQITRKTTFPPLKAHQSTMAMPNSSSLCRPSLRCPIQQPILWRHRPNSLREILKSRPLRRHHFLHRRPRNLLHWLKIPWAAPIARSRRCRFKILPARATTTVASTSWMKSNSSTAMIAMMNVTKKYFWRNTEMVRKIHSDSFSLLIDCKINFFIPNNWNKIVFQSVFYGKLVFWLFALSIYLFIYSSIYLLSFIFGRLMLSHCNFCILPFWSSWAVSVDFLSNLNFFFFYFMR